MVRQVRPWIPAWTDRPACECASVRVPAPTPLPNKRACTNKRTHARVSPARAQVQPTRAPGTARGAPPSAATRRRGTAPGFYPSAPARPSAVLQAEAGRSAPCSGITALLFSRSVVPDLWRPHGLQRARLPCPPLRSTAGKSSAVSKGFLPFTKPRAVHKTQLTK